MSLTGPGVPAERDSRHEFGIDEVLRALAAGEPFFQWHGPWMRVRS